MYYMYILQTKLKNRVTEFLLQDVETLSSLALATVPGFKYPAAELLRLWKLVLINQFHDVLPGSSIEEVYKDAIEYYKGEKHSSWSRYCIWL